VRQGSTASSKRGVDVVKSYLLKGADAEYLLEDHGEAKKYKGKLVKVAGSSDENQVIRLKTIELLSPSEERLGCRDQFWFQAKDIMQPHAVKVPVTASVPFECEFWPEDDGWTGFCPQLKVTVRGNNFEDAKKNMEVGLQSRIESIVRPRSAANVAA
jgi:hypothetical protein